MRCAPTTFAAAAASAFATPLPRSSPCWSTPIAPTHETTASGDPMASCNFSREPRVNSFLTHDTCFVQSSPLHHSGTSPVLETDTTSTEDEEVASAWHTRLPTNPVPPRTVTFSADAAETNRHRRSIE